MGFFFFPNYYIQVILCSTNVRHEAWSLSFDLKKLLNMSEVFGKLTREWNPFQVSALITSLVMHMFDTLMPNIYPKLRYTIPFTKGWIDATLLNWWRVESVGFTKVLLMRKGFDHILINDTSLCLKRLKKNATTCQECLTANH